MKKIYILLLSMLAGIISAKAQIQHVIVENYYVSDANDATDTTNLVASESYGMPVLPVGSKTYRIYVQLDHGFKIKKIYGANNHPLKIISTANFFNNVDRPASYFGYLINKAWFSDNPTLALDSWLTLGACTTNNTGVLKTDDADGSLLFPNGGGTAAISSGLLKNNDPSAGIPLDTADGMAPPIASIAPLWSSNGFLNSSTDTSIFGSENIGSQFISTSAYLQQNTGQSGDTLTGNKILVAQLTTTGDLSFELNLELVDSAGDSHNFVASSELGTVTGDTIVNGLLKYPTACGCKDPNFLEYNSFYGCSNPDSCHTRIVYGCTDTLACNYDPHANFNIQYLCCYPGNCNDRDIDLVCPSISEEGSLQLYPNPASEQITLEFSAGNNNETHYGVYDAYGTLKVQKDLGIRSGSITEQVNISDLNAGLYFIKVFIGDITNSKMFMKQ